MITLYTTYCPKCKVLEAKLQQKGLEFTLIDDQDLMIEKGFMEAPILEVDGETMDFTTAITWVKGR